MLLFSHLINGLILGMIFTLISIGLTIIFGMIGIVNFAHGAFFALGAYLGLKIMDLTGFIPALIIVPIMVGIIGSLIETGLFRPLYDKHHLFGLFVSFGLIYVIEDAIRIIWGPQTMPFPTPSYLKGVADIFGILSVSKYRIFVLLITLLALFLVWFFLEKTPYGAIIRAGSRDKQMVDFLGIRTPRVFTFVFGFGCFFAGLAGILSGPMWGVYPDMGSAIITTAFVIVVLGGLGSFGGAIVSGIIIGEVISISTLYWPPLSEAIIYMVLALVLLIRPRGLFGERWEAFE
jgi:branched-chain amino acid transport system permease protein